MNDALEILFTGYDRGLDQGVEHAYERSLKVEDALREEVSRLRDERVAAPSAARRSLRLVVPDWYGMASVKWLKEIKAIENPSRASSKCSRTTTGSPRRTRARP